MTTIFVTVTPAEGTELSVSADDAETWRAHITEECGEGSGLSTLSPSPFEASVAVNVAPEEDEAVDIIAKAFAAIGVKEGTFELALSEHDDDDVDFEAPAYFSEEVDLRDSETRRTWVAVSLDLYAAVEKYFPRRVIGTPFTDEQVDAMGEALRSRLSGPVHYFGRIQPGLTENSGIRLLLEPVPPEDVLNPETLKALIFAAIEEVGVDIVKAHWGAYIRDWDNTVFEDEHEKPE